MDRVVGFTLPPLWSLFVVTSVVIGPNVVSSIVVGSTVVGSIVVGSIDVGSIVGGSIVVGPIVVGSTVVGPIVVGSIVVRGPEPKDRRAFTYHVLYKSVCNQTMVEI